jgi:hypothetical protein
VVDASETLDTLNPYHCLQEAGIEPVIAASVGVAGKYKRKNVGVMFNLHHFKVKPKTDLKATFTEAKPLLWQVSTCRRRKRRKQLGTAHSDFGPWQLRSSRTFPDASRIRLQRKRRVPVLRLAQQSQEIHRGLKQAAFEIAMP